ncbi:hypothetical protein SERLA73DRAFT_186643 [Serpula lacrymans var. lacrymans S7.3]|uniref:Uncharacterized protein n=2 Tax=Serpula lacrymans var. lacrymans TaxID=341189 RepID=F8Q7M3_SERL3|nr:uncharacterized protein SERLADRAFT_475804 [Serpula lacrymans var. lacrymans S7.9]EGN95561.1 hypothetical protein SERLA73DRAFT_186643 [Serpula lacrymans var. lacrymans S7.3]EGO21089.1 hypothetical protein SERLADRAFT_475804 [Serpula lacrymans var. lacrymans S7.9]
MLTARPPTEHIQSILLVPMKHKSMVWLHMSLVQPNDMKSWLLVLMACLTAIRSPENTLER